MKILRKLLFIYFTIVLLVLSKSNYVKSAQIMNDKTNISKDSKLIKKDYTKYKSLMFTEANIRDIFGILLKFNENIAVPKEEKSDQKNRPIVNTIVDENNISVYLNSIMYISKNTWSVWVNETKITNLSNGSGEIVVKAISPLYAVFEWTIGSSRWNIINANGLIPDSKYKINDDQITLTFALSPNQTYIPSTDRIIEGKLNRNITEDGKNPETENKNTNNITIIQQDNDKNSLSNQDNLFF